MSRRIFIYRTTGFGPPRQPPMGTFDGDIVSRIPVRKPRKPRAKLVWNPDEPGTWFGHLEGKTDDVVGWSIQRWGGTGRKYVAIRYHNGDLSKPTTTIGTCDSLSEAKAVCAEDAYQLQ